ncbi:MAG: ABC transporter ATP-binding protein [Anaerolineaceae bacterium]|nr:ABC transporter ATP-binding protein [Anaerolineaceae bacterium]
MSEAVQPPIIVNDLCKYFETKAGNVSALDHISFSVADGDFVGIVGKSGSGKSTLINMLAGIDKPSSGSVSIFGRKLEEMNENELSLLRGSDVGIVFQFFQLLPVLTVLENVLLPMDFLGRIPENERLKRAREVLKMLDMEDHADKLPSELSGGLQQKAAIARALANDPPIIIADEPTGNLDSVAAEKIFYLFEELSRREKTIVVVTHDSELVRMAHRILTIRDGALIHDEITDRGRRMAS